LSGSTPAAVWHLETDASLNLAKTRDGLFAAGGGVVLRDPTMRLRLARSIELGYVPSATHAEYGALIQGMEIARAEGAKTLRVRVDNTAVIQQFFGRWEARSPGIPELLARVRELAVQFQRFDLRWAHSAHGLTRADGAPTADA
jgi:ribonuclease HI